MSNYIDFDGQEIFPPNHDSDVKFSRSKRVYEKAISAETDEVLRDAVNHAWNRSRKTISNPNQPTEVKCPFELKPEELGWHLKESEMYMRFITDACIANKINSDRKKITDEDRKKFKEALQRRRETSGKKPKAEKKSQTKTEDGISKGIKYRTDDPKEKAVIEAIFQAHKSKILHVALPMIKSGNPTLDIDKIMVRMGL